MIDFLYTNGCSWTYGNGLHEDIVFKNDTNIRTYDEFTWPCVLAKKMNIDVINDGRGAGSNDRIVRKTTEFLKSYPKDKIENLLVIIGWTTIERNEIYIDHPGFYDWFNYNAAQHFSDQFSPNTASREKQFTITRINKVQKEFVTWVHSNYADVEKYFQHIYLMKNLLENMKVKYMFFNALPWTWVPLGEISNQLSNINYTDYPYFVGAAAQETMMSFCKTNNYPISTCMHPMVEGHKQWADHLYKSLQIHRPEVIK